MKSDGMQFMRTNPKKISLPVLMLGFGAAGLFLMGLFRSKGRRHPSFPAAPYFTENRVYVKDYGRVAGSDPRLVRVPGMSGNVRVHREMADRLQALMDAAASDGFTDIRIASGWRPHLWRDDRDYYEREMIRQYGSVAEGRKWKAFNSAHETGLAVDFGSYGLYPTKNGTKGPFKLNNAQQKQTLFYNWLRQNAHKYGITPYKLEAWHWEAKVPYADWARA